ncbi:MAG TPA: hypothetical protein VM577_13190 [Anaerovoracaceae bacterium]|nr:hypothetical protein [Anaerovoracaceae bacterium]
MSDKEEELTEEEKKLRRQAAIPTAPSANLAAFVVIYKSLGIDKDFALLCMEELAKRRAEGEVFDYEAFIEREVAKIPKIDQPIDMVKISQGFMGNVSALKDVIKSAQSLKEKMGKK